MLQNTELIIISVVFNASYVPGTVPGDGDMGQAQNSSQCSHSRKEVPSDTYTEVR